MNRVVLPVKYPIVIDEDGYNNLNMDGRKKARVLINRAKFLEQRCAAQASCGAPSLLRGNDRDREEHNALRWCLTCLGIVKEKTDEALFV